MGQGSDMLRTAIASAIPGAATFSKAEANSALDKFDIQVNVLRTGVPGKEITSKPQGIQAPSPKGTAREQAIAELQKRGKVVNEDTIKQAIELMGTK
jgi:hypothetical protein